MQMDRLKEGQERKEERREATSESSGREQGEGRRWAAYMVFENYSSHLIFHSKPKLSPNGWQKRGFSEHWGARRGA